jgi:hypothetical protein
MSHPGATVMTPASPRPRERPNADADQAMRALGNALLSMLDRDQAPPCAGDDRWTSDDHTTRTDVAKHCQPCPLLDPCGTAATATKARFGTWAGIDRTPRGRTP